jgi:hypothetical protein
MNHNNRRSLSLSELNIAKNTSFKIVNGIQTNQTSKIQSYMLSSFLNVFPLNLRCFINSNRFIKKL